MVAHCGDSKIPNTPLATWGLEMISAIKQKTTQRTIAYKVKWMSNTNLLHPFSDVPYLQQSST